MVATEYMPGTGGRHRLTGGIVPDSPWELKQEEPTFEELLQDWRENVAQIKEVAAARLYDSEGDICLGDLWMHRFLVSKCIFEMQGIVINRFAKLLGESIDTPLPPVLEEVEKEIAELVDLLHQWHGSPETQADIPEEFIQSMKEAMNGETEDFDLGFHARLAAAK